MSFVTDEDVTLVVPAPGLLAKSVDVNEDTLTAALVSPPANGNATVNLDGSFTFKPLPDFNGKTSFVFSVTDGKTAPVVATAWITVSE